MTPEIPFFVAVPCTSNWRVRADGAFCRDESYQHHSGIRTEFPTLTETHTMKTPAIIASLTVVGSIAYAAGSQGVAGKQPPLMPSGSKAHSIQEAMPQARMQMAGGCTAGADKNWFTTGHLLPACFVVSGIPLSSENAADYADVNGDGITEFLLRDPNGGMGSYAIVANGAASTVALISSHECGTTGGAYFQTISCVLRGEAGDFYLKHVPEPATDVSAELFLRDMDSDGDMDLVVSAGDDNFWLENTGFQHTNPIAADLNRDGRVDGADLSRLLVSWGQTQ
jgi:hypothetical protein